MDRFSALIESSKQAIRHWWLLLLVGIVLLGAGIAVFFYPQQSYLGLAVLFGWLMLFSGVLEVALASMNRHHYITGRGWMFVGGIFEIILGFILILNVAVSAVTLPIVLGFWLLMRSFTTIGLGGDMTSFGIPGSGWTLFTGILLMLCALWILFQPLVFGTTAVLVWVGVSLLFAGAGACSMALQLRHAHQCMEGRH